MILDEDDIEALRGLEKKGLVEITKDKDGNESFVLTPLGKTIAEEIAIEDGDITLN